MQKRRGDWDWATIRGTVVEEIRFVLTNPDTYATEYPAPDEDVWIVYGNNVSPDERVRTNYDGEFEFQFLRPGEYTIYVYSRDTTGAPDGANSDADYQNNHHRRATSRLLILANCAFMNVRKALFTALFAVLVNAAMAQTTQRDAGLWLGTSASYDINKRFFR